ncbi:hypothetical protein SAMD00019534_115480, partial [Acytostelium subglobosum LB1]|uniref:hypothetical protein n=1 Tax=Acytostelium subglobosum LB1 TaxID=1410327 RepID=UPI000645157E
MDVDISYALVLYDFEAANTYGEMELVQNSIIVVTEMSKDGWWKGYNMDRTQFGEFPYNYVRLLDRSDPDWSLEL